MTGTNIDDLNVSQDYQGPAIVLVNAQMGENIGAAARAMLNCGLNDLRLVNPRDGWPSDKAVKMSSGALNRMPPVRVFTTTEEAVADCQFVLATTARPRDMFKPVYNARSGAESMYQSIQNGQRCAYLFGAERTGLENDDVALAHGVLTVPLNPGFSSLNLGQGVLLAAYEWYQKSLDIDNAPPPSHAEAKDIASIETAEIFYNRLEDELEKHNFFRSEGKETSMRRIIRSLIGRAQPTNQELQTLHGVVSALIGNKM